MSTNKQAQLAKQGNPEILAQIINRSLEKKGIKADVVRSNTSLEVTLESEKIANQKEALVQFIHSGMDKLGVESINKVTVYGVPTGQSSPVWEEDIILAAEEIAQPIPEDDPLYATEEAETALETDEDYQTEPPDDFSEDEDELFDEEDEVSSEADLEEDSEEDLEAVSEGDFEAVSEGDFEEDSEGDFEEDSEGDFEDEEYEEELATPAKKKLPILAIVVPLVILVPLAALAVLHFTGLFRLPFLGGSSSTPETVQSPEGSPSPPETTISPAQGSSPPSPGGPSGEEIWNNARSTAYGAAVKAGEAQTRAEWNEVASQWQEAIDLMKDVPESNPNYQTAQQKAEEYQNNLNVAKQRAARAPN